MKKIGKESFLVQRFNVASSEEQQDKLYVNAQGSVQSVPLPDVNC